MEGLLTTVVALGSRWLIADWPEDAKFLDSNERALLIHKLSQDEGTFKMELLDKQTFQRILEDWKIWVRWETSQIMISFELRTPADVSF